jgi:glycosyltransferase involved in cell wall biosynthesis
MTRQHAGADKLDKMADAGKGDHQPRHVWMLNHYAQQPGGAGGTRHYSLARHLRAHGWKTTIIAASTDHFSGQQRLQDGEHRKIQQFDGVPFLWLRTGGYSGNGLSRMWNMLQYTLAALNPDNTSDLDRPDIIIGSSVHPLAAWAGLRLARRFNVPFVFEVRDLWPQTLVDMGRLSERHPVTLALKVLEKSLYKNAARIITLMNGAPEYISAKGVPPERVVWIPNGADLDMYPDVAAAPLVSDTFTFMYFGAHGQANGLNNLIQAMRLVEDAPDGQHIRLRLVGSGPAKPALMELARELALTRVQFGDPVPKGEIPALAAEADAFVICVLDMPRLYRFGISMNKIFDYMAAGRPIIISADVPGNPVSDASAGITVPPENPDELAAAILTMAALPADERRRLGQAGRHHLEQNYSMEVLAGKLASAVDACLSPARAGTNAAAN